MKPVRNTPHLLAQVFFFDDTFMFNEFCLETECSSENHEMLFAICYKEALMS